MKSYNVTIQIKDTEQFFAVVFFIMIFKIILTSESVSQILKSDHSNEVSEHYFPVVVFIMLYDIDTSVLLENIPLVKFIKTTSRTRVVYFP